MNYEDVVRDFAERTRKNLEFIKQHADESGAEVYEVTQLINSMLGLLVFPQQEYFNAIPETPLPELERQGWPRIEPTIRIEKSADYEPCKHLRDLMRYLRNGISHFNIKFLGGEGGHISGIRIRNIKEYWVGTGAKRHKKRKTTWEAEIALDQLREITERFLAMLLEEVGV